MSTSDTFPSPGRSAGQPGEPVWDLALMYPFQGGWTVQNYLALDGGLLVEYTDGFIRVLPMPNLLHQWIVRFLFRLLDAFVTEQGVGEVLIAPLPVQLTATKYREPDLVFLRPERIRTWSGQPAGADLVIEVVSEGPASWQRDHVEKRADYAAAGIFEYWIVDPQERTCTVLFLSGSEYVEQGIFRPGDQAHSRLLNGFQLCVADMFARCENG